MSYNTKFIISAAAVLALTATACHREELRLTPAPASSLVLTAGLPEFETQLTKSGSLTADSLFAYPYWENMTGPSEAVRNNSFADGRYYFLIPSEASGIVFTNISEYAAGIKVTPAPAPEILLEFASDTGRCFGHDLIYGSIADYDATAAEQSIRMKRAVARITPTLCHIIGEDTVATSLNTFYDSVSLTLGGIYQGARIDTVSLTASYFGSDSFSLPFNVTGEACTMNGFYTLPSAEGTPTVSLDLLMTGSSEPVRISAPLPEPILANRDYNMTFYLHRDNMEGNISLSVEVNEIIKNVSWTDSFDLIEFSSRSLVFEVDAGSTAELTVYSKIGSWSATIPAEVLSYYTVANSTSGDTATVESPTITGHSGDVVTFKTLSNISDHEVATIFSIPFSAEPNNTYELTVMQSNGQRGVVDFILEDGSDVTFTGYCDLYRMDGGDSTLIVSSTDSMSYSLTSGTYRIAGPVVTSLETKYVNSVSVNSAVFNSLKITDARYLGHLDISGAPMLTTLYLNTDRYNPNSSITSLDLSGFDHLRKVSISGFNSLASISTGDGLNALESFYIYESKATTIDLTGCAALTVLSITETEPDSLILAGCSSLEEFSHYGNSSLKYLNVDGCSSMHRLNIQNCDNLNTLNLSELPALDTLSTHYCKYLRDISLVGCSGISYFNISELPRLRNIEIDDASAIRKLRIYSVDSLKTLDMRGWHIDSLNLDQYTSALDTLNADNSTLSHINGSTSLIEFRAANTNLKSLPANMSYSELRVLDVSGSKIEQIIWKDISGLKNLDTVKVNNCTSLKTFYLYNWGSNGWPAYNLLDLSECTSLDSLYIFNYGSENTLDTLNLTGCSSLRSVRLEGPMTLKNEGLILDGASINRMYIDNLGAPALAFSNSTVIDSLYIGTSSGWEDLLSLYVDGTGIKSLTVRDMSGLSNILANDCSELETLDIENCYNISTLEIDNSTGIKFFRLWNDKTTNMASRFSISTLTSLEELHLSNIEHFTRLDLRNMQMLEVLNVQRDKLSVKAMTAINCTGLTNLRDLSYNISPDSLYVDGCTSLHNLTLDGSYLKVAGLTGLTSLDTLEINNTALTELTLPDLPSLLYVSAYRNDNMRMLNIPGENKVEDLILSGNKITFSKCTLNVAETLKYLFLGDYYSFSDADSISCVNYPSLWCVRLGGLQHELTSLNFSGCTNLKAIVNNNYRNDNNRIKKVNLEGCTSLVVADFQSYTGLNSLNITGCESLRGLDLYNCNFDAAGLESIFDQLPTLTARDGVYRIQGCPGESTCDQSVAVDKKWSKVNNDISIDDYDL